MVIERTGGENRVGRNGEIPYFIECLFPFRAGIVYIGVAPNNILFWTVYLYLCVFLFFWLLFMF